MYRLTVVLATVVNLCPKFSISDSKRHGANIGLALKTDSSLRPAQGIVFLF